MSLSRGTLSAAGHVARIKLLYKRALMYQMDWTIDRNTWYEQADDIRAQFEQNRSITNPEVIDSMVEDAFRFLESRRSELHYRPIYRPGGCGYMRYYPAIPPTEEEFSYVLQTTIAENDSDLPKVMKE